MIPNVRFILNNKSIELGNIIELNYTSSYNNLTDSLSIIIPFIEAECYLKHNNTTGKSELVLGDKSATIGDFCVLYVDYNVEVFSNSDTSNTNELNQVFEGFISGFELDSNNSKITIRCEDYMWLFKQVTVKKNFDSFQLATDALKDKLYINNLKHPIGIYNDVSATGDNTSIRAARIKDEGVDDKCGIIDYIVKAVKDYWIINNKYKEFYFDFDYEVLESKVNNKSIPISSGNFFITNETTCAVVLDKLCKEYDLKSFFRLTPYKCVDDDTLVFLPKLYVGLKYPLFNKEIYYKENYKYFFKSSFSYPYVSASNPIISHNLEYNYSNKNNLIVYGKGKDKDNKEIYYYTIDGNNIIDLSVNKDADAKDKAVRDIVVTLNINGITESSLKALMIGKFNNYPDNGFTGTFETFGYIYLRQGDLIEMVMSSIDSVTQVKELYTIEKVELKFSIAGGLKQTITLGDKVSDTDEKVDNIDVQWYNKGKVNTIIK